MTSFPEITSRRPYNAIGNSVRHKGILYVVSLAAHTFASRPLNVIRR